MGIEKLLTPFKAAKNVYNKVDDFVLRIYSKATSHLEEKSNGRYGLALGCTLASLAVFVMGTSRLPSLGSPEESGISPGAVPYALTGIIGYLNVFFYDTAHSVYNLKNNLLDSMFQEKRETQLNKYYKSVAKALRLPYMVGGLALLGTFAYGAVTKSFTPVQEMLSLLFGTGLTANSSSMYIKSHNKT
jgi:hypothetical protein